MNEQMSPQAAKYTDNLMNYILDKEKERFERKEITKEQQITKKKIENLNYGKETDIKDQLQHYIMNYRAETTTNPPNSKYSSIRPYMDQQSNEHVSSPTNNLFSRLYNNHPTSDGGKRKTRKIRKSRKSKKTKKTKKSRKSRKSKKLSA
jgi:hypothetical protein